jgi:hypothetical protein
MLCTLPTGALAGGGAVAVGGWLAWLCAGGTAGAGGASTAGMVALACWLPGGGGGPGGGTEPRPNRSGDALGEEGSAIGAAEAMCCAFVLSAISASAILASAARSGAAGLGGTDARLG